MTLKFVRNYKDESTERGFQFEFCCDRCGTGYRTSFKTSATGVVSEALDVASGLMGGIFGKAARVGERIPSAAWEKAHDKAFAEAVEEIKPNFVQCTRCTKWVYARKAAGTRSVACAKSARPTWRPSMLLPRWMPRSIKAGRSFARRTMSPTRSGSRQPSAQPVPLVARRSAVASSAPSAARHSRTTSSAPNVAARSRPRQDSAPSVAQNRLESKQRGG